MYNFLLQDILFLLTAHTLIQIKRDKEVAQKIGRIENLKNRTTSIQKKNTV